MGMGISAHIVVTRRRTESGGLTLWQTKVKQHLSSFGLLVLEGICGLGCGFAIEALGITIYVCNRTSAKHLDQGST